MCFCGQNVEIKTDFFKSQLSSSNNQFQLMRFYNSSGIFIALKKKTEHVNFCHHNIFNKHYLQYLNIKIRYIHVNIKLSINKNTQYTKTTYKQTARKHVLY